jgi:hypothetical protein
MAQYDSTNPGPCCKKIDDMIQYARPIIERWPPFHKYTIGEDIMQEMLLMLRLATKARLRYMNKSTLADLDTSKAVLEVLIQQANNVVFTDRSGQKRRLLTDHSYGVWSEKLVEIGRLIGAWQNSVKDRRNSNQ